jgi:MYXO-CTERM domain-containing protein
MTVASIASRVNESPLVSRLSLPTRLAIAVPHMFGLIGCMLLQPEAESLLAPFLGPWSGHLYGHADCTMASSAPGWTAALVLLALAAIGLFLQPRRGRNQVLSPALTALAALCWVAAAVLSVANTTI